MQACVFCKIIQGEVKASFVYEDDLFYAFEDIKPDAEVHIQLIPKNHISNVNSLTPDDVELVKAMKERGEFILADFAGEKKEVAKENWKFVFHIPPYNSVDHLHMHCMAGKHKVLSRITHGNIFPWVMTIDTLLNKLRRRKK